MILQQVADSAMKHLDGLGVAADFDIIGGTLHVVTDKHHFSCVYSYDAMLQRIQARYPKGEK